MTSYRNDSFVDISDVFRDGTVHFEPPSEFLTSDGFSLIFVADDSCSFNISFPLSTVDKGVFAVNLSETELFLLEKRNKHIFFEKTKKILEIKKEDFKIRTTDEGFDWSFNILSDGYFVGGFTASWDNFVFEGGARFHQGENYGNAGIHINLFKGIFRGGLFFEYSEYSTRIQFLIDSLFYGTEEIEKYIDISKILYKYTHIFLSFLERSKPSSRIEIFFCPAFLKKPKKLEARLTRKIKEIQKSSSVRVNVILELFSEKQKYLYDEIFKESSRLGKIATGNIKLEDLTLLERDPNVLRIEESRELFPETSDFLQETDASIPQIKADVIHNDFQEKGDQAILAFIDRSFDLASPTFLGSNQTPRILFFRDELGQEHTQTTIQTQPSPPSRENHGTAIASIAGGKAIPPFFQGGVAPEASLIFVSLGQTKVNSHNVLDALAYIKRKATERELPIVVNLSFGLNLGSHDGANVFEKGCDEFLEDGKALGCLLIKSAGNERTKNRHCLLKLENNTKAEIRWNNIDPKEKEFALEFWFSGDPGRVSFTLRPPSATPQTIDNKNLEIQGTTAVGTEYGANYEPFDDYENEGHLEIFAKNNQSIERGEWSLTVEVENTVEMDGWIEKNESFAFSSHRDDSKTVTTPGNAKSIITVGSKEYSGNTSSQGPTREGINEPPRKKPEFTAPGNCISTISCGSQVEEFSGTSFAASHAAGAFALLLSALKKRGRPLCAGQLLSALESLCPGWRSSKDSYCIDLAQLFKHFSLNLP